MPEDIYFTLPENEVSPQEFANLCRSKLKELRMFEAGEKLGNVVAALQAQKASLGVEVKEWQAKIEAVKAELEEAEKDHEAFIENFITLSADKHAALDKELKLKTDKNQLELDTQDKAIEKAKADLAKIYLDIDNAEIKRVDVNKDLAEKNAEIERIKAKFIS